MGLAAGVLLHLAGPAATAHPQVLQRSTKARLLVALKVVYRDDNIRIHNGVADFCLLHILTAGHRHQNLVGAL